MRNVIAVDVVKTNPHSDAMVVVLDAYAGRDSNIAAVRGRGAQVFIAPEQWETTAVALAHGHAAQRVPSSPTLDMRESDRLAAIWLRELADKLEARWS